MLPPRIQEKVLPNFYCKTYGIAMKNIKQFIRQSALGTWLIALDTKYREICSIRKKKTVLKKQINALIDFFRNNSQTLADGRFECNSESSMFCFEDNTEALSFDSHYTYHPAWAARILAMNRPEKHIDISSIIEFSTIVSAFIPIDFYEYRPASIKLPNLSIFQCDILALPFEDKSIQSLSCMHVVEHVGLGRYGDTIDPSGDLKAALELQRVLAPNGTLLFVVPVGRPLLRFNAHRIYSYELIIQMFKELNLKSFSLINDHCEFIQNADFSDVSKQTYACGCFEFTKFK